MMNKFYLFLEVINKVKYFISFKYFFKININ